MFDFIIKLLGGYTKNNVKFIKLDLENSIYEYKKKSFRKGDLVYVISDKYTLFNYAESYYLIEPYNNGDCWYVSKDINDKKLEARKGINIEHISHEQPIKCKCCNQFLKNDK